MSKTFQFVAKQEDKYFYLNTYGDNDEWQLRNHLSDATMYPIVSDLEHDLEKDNIIDFEIVPVEITEMK